MLHPKVLLLDFPSSSAKTLQAAGYNVANGTFGPRIETSPSGAYAIVDTAHAKIPDASEQEIICVNLANPQWQPIPVTTNENVHWKTKALWQDLITGQIDPRPAAMSMVQDVFNQIWRHEKCLFIVCLGQPEVVEYKQTRARDVGDCPHIKASN